MSLQYCEYCNTQIDTDYDAEHFSNGDEFECIEEEIEESKLNNI